MEDLPFKAEYSKSNRASCKKCKCKIDKDVLRIAAMIQSFRHDGKDPHWYHFDCFFGKHRPRSIDDIDGIYSLRPEDQKRVRESVGKGIEILLPEPSTSKGKKSKKRKADMERLKDFRVEYAKSGRSVCAGCGDQIPNKDVRIIYTSFETEVGERFGGQAFSHHPTCFNEIRANYNFYLGGDALPGFHGLEKEDQKIVKEAVKAIELTESQAKKLKAEPVDKKEAEKQSKLEKLVDKQGKQLFKVLDTIKKITSKSDLQNILFVNNSGMVVGENAMLERCADFLTFGAIDKCPVCKKGDLIFGRGGYICNGNIDQWTACSHFEEKPARRECIIPKELKKKAKEENFFTKYKPKVEDRAVMPRPPEINIKIKKGETGEREFKVKRPKDPLYGMHIVALGKLEMDKALMKKKIEKMGGRLVTKLQEKIAAVISTPDEVEKMNKRMMEVESFQIQVVPESFLDAVEKGTREEAIEKIRTLSISSWGSDPLTRIPLEEEMKYKPRESIYESTSSKSKQQVVKLKNGSALDPQSGLEDIAHVFRDRVTNSLYTTVLNNIDIQKNKNSYYKMQVLEADQGRRYWLFRSWGRIGTKIGEHLCESRSSAEEACMEFEALFHEKTGNHWGASPFTKKANKYTVVDVDYTDDERLKQMEVKSAIPSKLPHQVQDIIKLIFDVEAMKQTMMEFELDLEKMPLGRLSKKQLEEAYTTLNTLDELITAGAAQNAFIGASNKFFSLVPHSFGMNAAPIIDTVEKIKSKREMIDSLLEIEVAYSIINDDSKENINPLDSHYEKLKTDMIPLDKESEEFTLIHKYVENTHAETHDQYKLEVEQVFKISRQGEKRRYKPFKKLHNRQLLWHGSRVTNYAGILSHGLKIAPPEAPCTGYMFGKGIYFADMVSKSANYCATTPHQNTGLMLLSEVALGDMHELTKAKFITKVPDGTYSVKGVGKTMPNPNEFHKREDGVIIPCGKPMKNETIRSELLYNEYIVYDVAQVNVQYLLKMKFNYNKRR